MTALGETVAAAIRDALGADPLDLSRPLLSEEDALALARIVIEVIDLERACDPGIM